MLCPGHRDRRVHRSGTEFRFDPPDVRKPCRYTILRLHSHKLNSRSGNDDLPSFEMLATPDQMVGEPSHETSTARP